MAAENNPFYVAPASPLQALMMGVQGYDRSQKSTKEAAERAAFQDVGQQIQSGGGINSGALGKLFALGPSAAPMITAAATLGKGDTTDEIKEYNLAKQQGFAGSFFDFKSQLKRAGATAVTVDNRGENEFEKEFGKDQAKRWSGYITGGETAQRKLVDINNLRELGNRIGSQGVTAGVKEALGPYAEAVGVDIAGLPDIQAYNSIIMRLAPQQRVPGSGATSDIEYKGMVASMPRLMQNPQAREAIINTMEAIERHDVARAEIASRLATRQINRGDAERALRALPDPMEGFVRWRKQNAAGGSSPPPASTSDRPAPAPRQADPNRPGPNVPGAKKAPDGNWYIERNGRHYRVDY